MNDKTRKRICVTSIVAVIFIMVICLLDYFNVASKLGINIRNMNWDVISLILSNIVVICLFLITYFIVDSRNIQKDKNQIMVAYIMLVGIYKRCQDMVDIFSDAELRTRAVQKCDFNKLLHEDRNHINFLNYPFEDEATIIDFAKAGILSKELFKEFTTIKQLYQKYINTSITLFDVYAQFSYLEDEIRRELTSKVEKLEKSIENDTEADQ